MAGASLNLTLDSLRDYLEALSGAISNTSLRKPLKTIGFYLANKARESFDQSREPDGTLWAPLIRPSKRRGGASAKPLRDTDTLMGSLVGRGANHIERVSDTALEWGTGIDYASFHQYGTKHMVARPFEGVTPDMKHAIGDICIEWFEKQLKESL